MTPDRPIPDGGGDGGEDGRRAGDGGRWLLPEATTEHGVAPPSRPELDEVATLVQEADWTTPRDRVSVLRVTISVPEPGASGQVRDQLVAKEWVLAADGTAIPGGTTILDLLLDGSVDGASTADGIVQLDSVIGVVATEFAVGDRPPADEESAIPLADPDSAGDDPAEGPDDAPDIRIEESAADESRAAGTDAASGEPAEGPASAEPTEGTASGEPAEGAARAGSADGAASGGRAGSDETEWLQAVLLRAAIERARRGDDEQSGEHDGEVDPEAIDVDQERLAVDLARLLARADRLVRFVDGRGPERLDSVETTVVDALDRVAALEESLEPVDDADLERLHELRTDLDELATDLEELQEWQRSLQTVFVESGAYPDAGDGIEDADDGNADEEIDDAGDGIDDDGDPRED